MSCDHFPVRLIFASAAAYCVANIGWWLQPSIINESILQFGVGESQAALVASVELAAVALSSLLTSRMIGKLALFKIALIGGFVAFLGAVLSVLANQYPVLLVFRSMAGIGEGALLTVATASLAGLANPARAYGVINTAAILVGSAAAYSLTFSSEFFDLELVVLPTIAICVGVMSSLALLMPNVTVQKDAASDSLEGLHPVLSWTVMSLVIAMFIISVTAAAMWSFFYSIGGQAGLLDSEVHRVVALAALLSVIGAMAATVIGDRFGRIGPISMGIVVLTVATVTMSIYVDATVFSICAVLIPGGMYFLVPFFLDLAARQDPSGRDAAVVAGAFLMTGAVGPYLAGYIISNHDIRVMAGLTVLLNIVGWLLFLDVNRRQAASEGLQAVT